MNAYQRILNACCGDEEQAELIATQLARIYALKIPGSGAEAEASLSGATPASHPRDPEPGSTLWKELLP